LKNYKKDDGKRLFACDDLEKELETYLIACHERCLEKLTEKSKWINKENKIRETILIKALDDPGPDKRIIEFLNLN